MNAPAAVVVRHARDLAQVFEQIHDVEIVGAGDTP
jgi:hypothetical protein